MAEQTVRQWMEAVTGEAFGEGSFASQLRSGERLCRLANSLRAGSVGKINSSSLPFKQMENISQFLKAARAMGVAEHDVFETVVGYYFHSLSSISIRIIIVFSIYYIVISLLLSHDN